jgi:hypothetical protein
VTARSKWLTGEPAVRCQGQYLYIEGAQAVVAGEERLAAVVRELCIRSLQAEAGAIVYDGILDLCLRRYTRNTDDMCTTSARLQLDRQPC